MRSIPLSIHDSPALSIQSPERGSTPLPPRMAKENHQNPRDNEDIPRGAKAKIPDAFEGKRRNQEAKNFLMKMEVYFNDYPGAFNENKKITATLSNMKEGDATRWAQPLLKRILEGTKHTACHGY